MEEKLKIRKVLTIGKINVGKLFFNNSFVIALLMIPFFKTSGYEIIPFLASLSNFILVIECVFFTILALLLKMNSAFFNAIILMELWSFVIAPRISGNEPPSLFYLAGAVGVISFFEVGAYYNPRKLLKASSTMFAIMIFLNFLTLLMPNGLYLTLDWTVVYLFGIRTGFTSIIVPGILICLIYNYYFKKGLVSWQLVISFLFGILSIFFTWIGTGILEILLLVFFIFALKKRNFLKVNALIIFLLIILINVMVTIIGVKSGLLSDVARFIGKDPTFTGRVYIWEQAIESIRIHPFVGYGLNATVDIFGTLKPAHNQWLHVALESGIISLSMLLFGISSSCKKVQTFKNEKIYIYILATFIATLVGSIAEIQTYNPFMYVVFEVPFLLYFFRKKV